MWAEVMLPGGDGKLLASVIQRPGYWRVIGEGTGGVDLESVYLGCCNCLSAYLHGEISRNFVLAWALSGGEELDPWEF